MKPTDLEQRILDISYKHKLSHLGSCLTAVGIIDEIFKTKKRDEKFVLDAAHSSLALYVVIEYNKGRNAEEIWLHHGTHADRCKQCGLDCSGGSLGLGGAIACGLALSDRTKNVWCLTTDGALQEGIWWETLRIAKEKKLINFKIIVNCNGFGAYKKINTDELERRLIVFGFPVDIRRTNSDLPFAKGLFPHYHILTEREYADTEDLFKM